MARKLLWPSLLALGGSAICHRVRKDWRRFEDMDDFGTEDAKLLEYLSHEAWIRHIEIGSRAYGNKSREIANLFQQVLMRDKEGTYAAGVNLLEYYAVPEDKADPDRLFLLLPHLYVRRKNRSVYRGSLSAEGEAAMHHMDYTAQLCLCYLLRKGYWYKYDEAAIKQEAISFLVASGLAIRLAT